jgi:hypothetical protein
MNRIFFGRLLLFLLAVQFVPVISAGQGAEPSGKVRSQEISEDDGQPVLIKHLPEWQNVRSTTVFTADRAALMSTVGFRPALEQVEFTPGTEAVTAVYPEGRLVIVEFSTPQGSVDADTKIMGRLATAPEETTVYRRIGNYNAFVFDAPDREAASRLLDQVKYEKNVQWLGEDPFLYQKFERYFITTTRGIFVSTVLWIVGGLGISAVLGVIAGIIFYRIREQKRANWTRFSDAGGLTRLNLDELSE